MSDEQKIVIVNNGGGVINVLIMEPNPIVISDPNITEPREVLPPGYNVDNSTIISPNNEIDITEPGEVLPPGYNVDNSTIISPNNNKIDVNEKKQVNLSNSPSPIESLVVNLFAFVVILIVLIYFWPYIRPLAK
jgi:hypothetical protein